MQRAYEAYVITRLHLGRREEPVCSKTSLLYLPLLQQHTALILRRICELFRIEVYMNIIPVNSVPTVSTFWDLVCYIDMLVFSPLSVLFP